MQPKQNEFIVLEVRSSKQISLGLESGLGWAAFLLETCLSQLLEVPAFWHVASSSIIKASNIRSSLSHIPSL